jgi:hypothetical protein
MDGATMKRDRGVYSIRIQCYLDKKQKTRDKEQEKANWRLTLDLIAIIEYTLILGCTREMTKKT